MLVALGHVISAAIMEFIDSFLGMMYGTVLSPLLIVLGYESKQVVPSILVSQALGGFIASWRHHALGNAKFSRGTEDFRVFHTVFWLGTLACVVGVFVSVGIPPRILNTYIAILVILIALLIFAGKTFVFTRGKLFLLGSISAFNKSLSGGGFGPLVAGGQLVLRGRDEKGAIGSTDFAEAPICLISFGLWVFASGLPDLSLMIALCIGSAVGGFFGPQALSRIISKRRLKLILGGLVLVEGLGVLYKTWGK